MYVKTKVHINCFYIVFKTLSSKTIKINKNEVMYF